MLKSVCVLLLFCASSLTFADCPRARPIDDVNFCASFKTAAVCYCTASGLPSGVCQDMNSLYLRMIAVYGSLKNACSHQPYTTPEDCINNWNCYLYGGIDSTGKLCSGTKNPC